MNSIILPDLKLRDKSRIFYYEFNDPTFFITLADPKFTDFLF